MSTVYQLDGKLVQLKVKSCRPYAKGWQINAFIDGEESEMTYYSTPKLNAIEQAKRLIAREGKLPHAPYRA